MGICSKPQIWITLSFPSFAFACSAKILFADEPTGNLDPKNGKLISDLLFEVNSERDNALVIVTHDQDLASQCDKKIELKLGKIID